MSMPMRHCNLLHTQVLAHDGVLQVDVSRQETPVPTIICLTNNVVFVDKTTRILSTIFFSLWFRRVAAVIGLTGVIGLAL